MKIKKEFLHLLIFSIICFLSFLKVSNESYKEKEVYLKLKVAGDIVIEAGGVSTTVKILESEIEELEGRKAFLKLFGERELKANTFILFGDVSVNRGRVFISGSFDEIEYIREEKGIRDFLIERYRENSVYFKESIPLGLSFLFGEPRVFLPSEVQRSFLHTGLIHLLVVSGLHIGTVALILSKILPKFYGYILSILGIVLYTAFIVPLEPPVMRASLMFLLIVTSLLFFRKPNSFVALLISGSVILLLFPHYVLSYSFWLSFVATACIIFSLRNFEGNKYIKSLLVSLSAFSGTSALISSFSFISPISVIFTPLIAPLVLIYSLLGVLSLLTFMSFSPLIDLFNLTGLVFIKTVELVEKLSFKLFPEISVTEGIILSFFCIFSLYFLKGIYKFLPSLSVLLYLTVMTL